jgi:hypothetical protein
LNSQLRLLPSLFRLLRPRLFRQSASRKSSPCPDSVFDCCFVSSSRAALLDIDLNLHKSNSTFFSDADINRAAFLTRTFGESLADPRLTADAAGKNANLILAGVQAKFLREVKPLQRYMMVSAILTWDERGLFVITYFVRPGRDKGIGGSAKQAASPARHLFSCSTDSKQRPSHLLAVLVSRYVARASRTKIEPLQLLQRAGLVRRREDGRGGWTRSGRLDLIMYRASCSESVSIPGTGGARAVGALAQSQPPTRISHKSASRVHVQYPSHASVKKGIKTDQTLGDGGGGGGGGTAVTEPMLQHTQC